MTEAQVRTCVQNCQAQIYASLVDQLAHDGSLHDFRSVFQLLNRLGGRPKHRAGQARPLPLLRDAQRQPVTTFEQQQRLWRNQFASIEGGLPMTRAALDAQMPACLGISADVIELHAIPTLTQLETKTRKMKRGKAPGPDGLPSDVYKAGALPLLQHVFALTTKSALHAREPGCWRGGRLIPLPNFLAPIRRGIGRSSSATLSPSSTTLSCVAIWLMRGIGIFGISNLVIVRGAVLTPHIC